MKITKLISRYSGLVLAIFSLFFGAGIFITTIKVSAQASITVTNILPDPSQVNNHNQAGNIFGHDGYLVVGNGDFNRNTLGFTFESTTSSVTLNLDHASICATGGVDDPNNGTAPVTSFYAGNNSSIYLALFTGRDCGGGLNRQITISNLMPLPDGDYGGFVYVTLATTNTLSQQNSFKVSATDPTVRIGFSDAVISAYKTRYPAISSFQFGINLANTSIPGGTESDFFLPVSMECSSTVTTQSGDIVFYDLDDTSAGGNLQGPGSGYESMALAIWRRPRTGGAWTSLMLRSLTGLGSGDKQELRVPITLDKGYQYQFGLMNVSRPNAVQFSIENIQITSDEMSQYCGDPIGYADSCSLVGSTTIIRGWAYDDDAVGAAGAGKPTTTVNIGAPANQSSTVESNVANYRSTPINNFLNSLGVGSNARDNIYGWTASFTGLTQGTNYSISGTVNNYLRGANQIMGVNPNNTVDGSPANGFPGGVIPQACLPPAGAPPSISCTITGPLSFAQNEAYTPQIELTNGSTTLNVNYNATFDLSSPATTRNAVGSLTPSQVSTVTFPPPITLSNLGNMNILATVAWTAGAFSGTANCNGIVKVGLMPYMRVFGGDVSVGTGLGVACTAPMGSGTVYAHNAGVSNAPTGAGVDFALFALGSVNGFTSSRRSPTATPAGAALTFANIGTVFGRDSMSLGGSMNGARCRKDFYGDTFRGAGMPVGASSATINAHYITATNAGTDQVQINGDTTISGGALAAGQRLGMYVVGDVYISNSITMATNYASSGQIPFFALIVRGNIFIGPGVSQIDGLIVAQENGGSGGSIYTCAPGFRSNYGVGPPVSTLHTSCGNKLTFNGAVSAKRIILQRTNGSVPASVSNETSASANIAEAFVAMPEMYIATPPFKRDPLNNVQYDNAASLAPIL